MTAAHSKQKPKNNTTFGASIKRSKKLKKLYILGILLQLVAVVVIASMVRTKINLNSRITEERRNFSVTQPVLDAIVSKLKTNYGLKDVQSKNYCYQTEQGPFDNGRRWCQIGYIGRMDFELPNTTQTLSDILLTFADENFGINRDGFGLGPTTRGYVSAPPLNDGRLFLSADYRPGTKPFFCTFTAEKSNYTDPIIRTSGNQLAFRLYCSQRASFQYYRQNDSHK